MKRILPLFVMLIATRAFAQDAPLPPRIAAQKMTLPAGFKATLFAGEPDVVQPIAFTFDDRGRVWVAECLSYPKWQPDFKAGKDRIIILEDTDGDGVHDKRTVFADNIQNLSGINYGFGGVWVCATPNLLFIPIKEEKSRPHAPREEKDKHHAERDVYVTKPAGPPEIVLDGWSLKAGHNVFNSLTWGPDGWLYGCNGIIATSLVGRPGTPDKDRVPINCGVWRYHPTKKKFEAVAHGTTNPWGLDFDEHGEMFITNCVIDHLWHVVPGAHYQRMYGNDLNPHVYKLMPSICDHIHWGGGSWTSSRAPSTLAGRASDGSSGYKVHSEAGGGHAHVGCMIYLGDNWPARYRGGVFMCNLHGNRINHDILERNGSTYVARHAKDFMHANDPWFRGMSLQYGPDGGVYVSDWTDTGECHNYKVADKTNGRIFKITYGDVKPWKGDLAKLSDLELAGMHASSNAWLARHARRLLQERAAARKIDPDAVRTLTESLELDREKDSDLWPVRRKLNALWTLHAIDRIEQDRFLKLCKEDSEYLRAWGARLMLDDEKSVKEGDKRVEAVWEMSRHDSSALVRLHLAGACKRMRGYEAAMRPLLWHQEDANDPFLPHMYYYATEYVLRNDPARASIVLSGCEIPIVRELVVRRHIEIGKRFATAPATGEGYDYLYVVLRVAPLAEQRDYIRGMELALGGRRQIPMPIEWTKTYPILIESPLPEVRERALALAVQFGDERAFTLLRKVVPDRAQPVKERENALKTLLFQQKPDLVPVLHDLLTDESMRGPAIRGLAAYDHAETPTLLLKHYAQWNADEKSDVIQTLSSRPKYALDLLGAIEKNAIPRQDINSFTIRQLQSLKQPELSARLAKVWGEVRPASADKAKLMAKYKAELKPDVLKKANLANGRALYTKACANCHRLFGEGGDIGPDLTGAQRMNLDYVLENVLDPSAIVPREYQVTIVETKGGRTLNGIVKKESDAAITMQLQNEVVVVPKSDIESRTPTKVSMMPDGAFEQLRIEEVRDLVAYLASPAQVAMKKQ